MVSFVNRPAHVNKRFDPIFEACRQNTTIKEQRLLTNWLKPLLIH